MRLRTVLVMALGVLVAFGLARAPDRAGAAAAAPSLVLFNPASGEWQVHGGDGAVQRLYYGTPGDVALMGDWDCDGIDTPGAYRQSNGYVYLRNSMSTGPGEVRFFLGNPGDRPLAGDFDGDGCDSVSVYRPSEGRAYITDRLGANEGYFVAEYSFYFGIPGDRPFVGDFDGNGTSTLGLYRESTGFAYFRQANTQGVADSSFFYGEPSDRIVAGDWDGNGTETVGIYRPLEGAYFLSNANVQGFADVVIRFGNLEWVPPGYGGTDPIPTVGGPRDLVKALEQGLIEANPTSTGGASGDVVELSVRRLVRQNLSITVPPGMAFVNQVAGQQDLVAARVTGERTGPSTYRPAAVIELRDDQSHVYAIEAYCAEIHRTNPSDGAGLVVTAPSSSDLVALFNANGRPSSQQELRAMQGAVWAITDDATPQELAAVGYGLSTEELGLVRSMMDRAGLDPARFRLFA